VRLSTQIITNAWPRCLLEFCSLTAVSGDDCYPHRIIRAARPPGFPRHFQQFLAAGSPSRRPVLSNSQEDTLTIDG